jgi:cytidine deaminase
MNIWQTSEKEQRKILSIFSTTRGLGDVVAKVIHSTTGIQPCGGCKKRQEALNRLVPFRQLTPPT